VVSKGRNHVVQRQGGASIIHLFRFKCLAGLSLSDVFGKGNVAFIFNGAHILSY